MRSSLLLAVWLVLAGCTNLANFNSIHRSVKLESDGSQLIDAKQRAIVVWPQRSTAGGAPGSTQVLAMSICAEPSPDAFSVLASSGELSASNASGTGVSGSVASTESGVSLSSRTTTILAQRDAYFRLCEDRANGWIDDIDLMVGHRTNQLSLVGMLAIEQLTGTVSAPTVALGGSAEAVSASAIQAIATSRTAEVKNNAELNKQKTSAIEARDTADANVKAQPALPAGADQPATAAHEAEKKRLAAALTAAQKKVDDLTAAIDSSDKVLAYYNKALDTAAATGSSASSIPAVIVPQPDPAAQQEAAKAVVEIVRMMNANDMGPTICLRQLRSVGPLGPEVRQKCMDILAKYVAGMQADVDAMSADTALKDRLVAILAAIPNPGNPDVFAKQVKPILDVLLALDRQAGSAGAAATIKSDPLGAGIIHNQ